MKLKRTKIVNFHLLTLLLLLISHIATEQLFSEPPPLPYPPQNLFVGVGADATVLGLPGFSDDYVVRIPHDPLTPSELKLEIEKARALEKVGGPKIYQVLRYPDGRFGIVMERIHGRWSGPGMGMSSREWAIALEQHETLARNGWKNHDFQWMTDENGVVRPIDWGQMKKVSNLQKAIAAHADYRGSWGGLAYDDSGTGPAPSFPITRNSWLKPGTFPTRAVIGGTALGAGTYLFPEAIAAHQLLSTWYPTMVLGSGARAGGGMFVYAAGGTAVPAIAAGSFLYGGLWIATEARARQDLFESLAVKSMTEDLSNYEQMWLNNSFGSGSARAKVHMANMVNESVFGPRKKPTTLALMPEVAPKKTNQSTDYLKPLQDLMEEYEKNPYKYLFGGKRDQPDAPDYSSDPLEDEDLSEIFLDLDEQQTYSSANGNTEGDHLVITEPIAFDDFNFTDEDLTPTPSPSPSPTTE